MMVRWCWMPIVSEAAGMRAVINVASSYAAEFGEAGTVRWMPMGLKMARAYAHGAGCVLPTRKVVDLAWSQAEVKLEPIPMPPDHNMSSPATITKHSLLIQEVLHEKFPKNWRINLMAGTHKDLVETAILDPKGGKLAIYGWHHLDGRPIQGLNWWSHSDRYFDYSHGVRLVKDEVLIGDEILSFRDVCASKELSILVSDEGPFEIPPYV